MTVARTILLYTDSHSQCGVGRFNAEVMADLIRAGHRVVCAQRREATPLLVRLRRFGVEFRWIAGDADTDLLRFANDRAQPAVLYEAVRPDVVVCSAGHPLAVFAATS